MIPIRVIIGCSKNTREEIAKIQSEKPNVSMKELVSLLFAAKADQAKSSVPKT